MKNEVKNNEYTKMYGCSPSSRNVNPNFIRGVLYEFNTVKIAAFLYNRQYVAWIIPSNKGRF